MDKGWISIHRKILKNPIVKMNKTYSRFEAWTWLLLRTTYSNQKVVLGSDIYHIKAGDILTSQKKLCIEFNWGNSKLRTFLTLLEKDEMVSIKTTKKLTMITILNYKDLQKNQITTKPQPNHNQIHSNKENKVNKDINSRYNQFLEKSKELKLDKELTLEFVDYWTEKNLSGKKMKFEMQKTFDIKRRLLKWKKNADDWGLKPKQNKNIDIQYPMDKTEKSRLCRCSKCNGIDMISSFNPNFDAKSNCCKQPIKPYKEI